jgi:hypothetical protein
VGASAVIVHEGDGSSYVDQFTGATIGPVSQWVIQFAAPTGNDFVGFGREVFHAPTPPRA